MPLHFQEAPQATVDALNAALPRIAQRASVATHAPAISQSVGALMRRRFGSAEAGPAPARAAAEPISAPVHIVGLNEIAAKRDLKAAPVKLWAHLLHTDDDDHPVAVADTDAKTGHFQSITEGAPIAALGRRIRTVQAEQAKAQDHDLAIIRVPALYLDALWLKGRNGAPDVVIPEASPMSPLQAGKRYTLEEFNAALKPTADRLLRETDPTKGG